jgi:hypothetical protein
MKKTRDLMVLAMEAYRQGQYEGCAKFFAEAMVSDDLSSFVDYIARTSDGSALHGTDTNNTLSPSLFSQASAGDSEFDDIVDHLNSAFVSEMSGSNIEPDERIEEIEARAASDEDDIPVVPVVRVSAGPVRIRDQ